MILGCSLIEDRQNPKETTEDYIFWTFQYLGNPEEEQRASSFAPPDPSYGSNITTEVHVEKGMIARFTVYEDSIQESCASDLVEPPRPIRPDDGSDTSSHDH